MLRFKEFIAESGDSSYEFHKYPHVGKVFGGGQLHKYSFKDTSGLEKRVEIFHEPDDSSRKVDAHVSFHDTDKETEEDEDKKHAATGAHRHEALKIFSTVKRIMKDHAKANSHIDNFVFSSRNNEPSRVKLYSKMTHKLGGETYHDPKYEYSQHSIPADKLKD